MAKTTVDYRINAVKVLAKYYDKALDADQLAMYCEGIGGLGEQQIQVALTRSVRELKWMPKVAEILELAGAPAAAPSIVDRAHRAFLAFEQAVSRHGGNKSVSFTCPIIHAVVRELGGWIWLTDRPESEFNQFIRPQFIKSYESLSKTGISKEQAAPLQGLLDQANGLAGYPQKQPILIDVGLPLLENCKQFAALLCGPALPAIEHREQSA